MFPGLRMFGSLFIVAFAIRSIGYPTVFSSRGVQLPYAGDAYYHLRRIWYSVARFPESLNFDRYVSYPEGSQIIWPATYDWTIAALIRPFVDPSDQHAVEALAAWAPVVFGAATAGLAGLLASRLYGRPAGWIAGCIYSVLPMGFGYSQLGMVDHHAAVALLTVVLLVVSSALFERGQAAQSWTQAIAAGSVRVAVVAGGAMALTLLVWPGALLHAVVLQMALVLRWLVAEDRESARARAIELSVSQAVVALCLAPFSLGAEWREFSDWSPLVLSNFQPIYFACAALMVAGVQCLHDTHSSGLTRVRRAVSGSLLGASGAIAGLVFFRPLREAVFFAGSWFSEEEILLRLASEMRPILMIGGAFDLDFAFARFGTAMVVLPFVWLYLARQAYASRSPTHGLLLFWALAFIALTLRQWRFGNTLAVVYAILMGAVLAEWIRALRPRFASNPLRPALEISLVLLLMGSSAASIAGFYRPIVRMNLAVLAGERPRSLGPLHPARRIYDEAGRWLARHTPRTSGYLDADVQPEYGVLADWSTGHLLRYRSERPMVQDNYGGYAGRRSFELGWAYFAEPDEATAIERLEELGVRYVVGGSMGAGLTDGLAPDAMAARLWTAFGAFVPTLPGSTLAALPGLERHRLLFHAHTVPGNRRPPGLTPPVPFTSVGIWEVVAGATIEGEADPGATIDLGLDLTTTSGANHLYRRRAVSDEAGRYRFVVPYPNDMPFSPDVRVASAYRLASATSKATISIREKDIVAGRSVRGPKL